MVYGQTVRTMSIVAIGQAAGWIRIPLGTEVGLGLCDIVLDRDPASPVHEKDRATPHTFRPTFLWHGRPLSACQTVTVTLVGWLEINVLFQCYRSHTPYTLAEFCT